MISNTDPVLFFRDEKAYHGDFLSWKKNGKRKHGKVFDPPEPYEPPRIGDWSIGEFKRAVADGRVPFQSVVLLQKHLTDHEVQYIR